MALDDAQRFVSRMKEDTQFRTKVQGLADSASLKGYLADWGFSFDMLDLVKAMAGCMEELDQMMHQMNPEGR